MEPESRSSPSWRASAFDAGLRGARLAEDNPWVDLFALPCAFLIAWAFTGTRFGRLLTVPLQIQFHELGHALVAWLTSRAALPLPFGFTFWREERSTFVACCVLFLLSCLLARAVIERRPFGGALALVLTLFWFVLSHVVSAAGSLRWVIWGGVAGEFLLTSVVLSAFFFRLPDRLRWDFFRFVALFPAAAVWLSAARLWRGIARGTEWIPLGSLLGSGDAGGDMDRLLHDYAMSEQALTSSYLLTMKLSCLLWAGCYVYFATRALRAIRQRA
ncbi:MAG: hypothetical protein QM778_12140 [Myxococcales bacterium]